MSNVSLTSFGASFFSLKTNCCFTYIFSPFSLPNSFSPSLSLPPFLSPSLSLPLSPSLPLSLPHSLPLPPFLSLSLPPLSLSFPPSLPLSLISVSRWLLYGIVLLSSYLVLSITPHLLISGPSAASLLRWLPSDHCSRETQRSTSSSEYSGKLSNSILYVILQFNVILESDWSVGGKYITYSSAGTRIFPLELFFLWHEFLFYRY